MMPVPMTSIVEYITQHLAYRNGRFSTVVLHWPVIREKNVEDRQHVVNRAGVDHMSCCFRQQPGSRIGRKGTSPWSSKVQNSRLLTE